MRTPNKIYITIASLLSIFVVFFTILSIPNLSNQSETLANKGVEDIQTIYLTPDNTPAGIGTSVRWDMTDFYATPSRYTEMHYRYVTKKGDAHVVLENYADGGLVQNSQPMLCPHQITINIESKTWSQLTYFESDVYGELSSYTAVQTIVLAKWNKTLVQQLVINTSSPYFGFKKTDGTEIYLTSMAVTYDCALLYENLASMSGL